MTIGELTIEEAVDFCGGRICGDCPMFLEPTDFGQEDGCLLGFFPMEYCPQVYNVVPPEAEAWIKTRRAALDL